MGDGGGSSAGRRALWARHHGPIRAFVEGLADGFGADPSRVYTGHEVDMLLRADLDLADVQHDDFDGAPTPDDVRSG